MTREVADSIARRFLSKAFDRAQTARSKGSSKTLPLQVNEAQCPELFATRDLDEAAQFRAEIAAAERIGAIRLTPAKRGAPPSDVKAIAVIDLELLAAYLGRDVRSLQVEQAGERLRPYLNAFPVLKHVLERWRLGKSVRGAPLSSGSVGALVDAIKVRLARDGQPEDALLRRASAQLFRDSKRIERLSRWLDLLGEGSLVPSGLSKAEIFSSLGLHKEPQPFLIAAQNAAVSAACGESNLFRPYHGLPAEAIERFHFKRAPSCLLTVENKATFHEIALHASAARVCIVFTGGMPSPAWKKAYAKTLESLGREVPVYHFGDLDVGGFRIAHAVSEVVNSHGRVLSPWLMDPAELVKLRYELYPAKQAQITAMRHWCERLGWRDLAAKIAEHPGLLEQENVILRLPRG